MTEIQGKSILVRVSEGSSYRESTVFFCLQVDGSFDVGLISGSLQYSYYLDIFFYFLFLFFKKLGKIFSNNGVKI